MAPQKRSAGLLLYRRRAAVLEVFLVHPGGPFWAKKDLGAWSIPKGEIEGKEEPLASAQREFQEETGASPGGPFEPLKPVTQRGGKVVLCWAVEGDLDPDAIRSNTFKLEWPPGSRRIQEFPEVDRGSFFGLEEARTKINTAQVAFLEELLARLTPEGISGRTE
jgi:predicted NUDIX family NTP pyrophosphohydrolase